MNQNNGFQEYKIHILAELQDLKEGQKRQDVDHATVRESLSEIKQSLASLKNDQKWHIRVASGAWGLLVIGVDALLRKW